MRSQFNADGSSLYSNEITFQTSNLLPWHWKWFTVPQGVGLFPEADPQWGEPHCAGSQGLSERLAPLGVVCPSWARVPWAVSSLWVQLRARPWKWNKRGIDATTHKAGPWARIRELACQLLSRLSSAPPLPSGPGVMSALEIQGERTPRPGVKALQRILLGSYKMEICPAYFILMTELLIILFMSSTLVISRGQRTGSQPCFKKDSFLKNVTALCP